MTKKNFSITPTCLYCNVYTCIKVRARALAVLKISFRIPDPGSHPRLDPNVYSAP